MNQHYPHMFAPLTVGNITFKNRVFSAPTTAHMIQNNAPSYPGAVLYCHLPGKGQGRRGLRKLRGAESDAYRTQSRSYRVQHH